jgi:hypothetical protein
LFRPIIDRQNHLNSSNKIAPVEKTVTMANQAAALREDRAAKTDKTRFCISSQTIIGQSIGIRDIGEVTWVP